MPTAPFSCAASALRQGAAGSAVTTPSNGLFVVALARLVVEHQHDLPGDVAAVVVVLPARGGDAEPGEDHRRGHFPAGAEALRVEVLAVREPAHRAVGAVHLQGAALAQRGGHQVVGLEIRAARGGRLQPDALEAGADVVGGGQVLGGVGEAAAHRIAGQEEEIGAQLVLADRLGVRRGLLLAGQRGGQDEGQRADRNWDERPWRIVTGSDPILGTA